MQAVSPNITKVTSINSTALDLISASDIGDWLNLSVGAVTKTTELIESLITSAVEIVEKYLWLDLRRKTYQAFYDLGSRGFDAFITGELRLSVERSPVLTTGDISAIDYLNDSDEWEAFDRGTAASVAGLYANTTERIEPRDWASLYYPSGIQFQDRVNAYKVRVTFDSGFDQSDALTAVPETLLVGIKMIVADRYRNRGDCSGCGCDLGGYPVPCDAKGMIDQYSIAKTVFGGSHTPAHGSDWGCF